jgi:2-methylcitrate synthase
MTEIKPAPKKSVALSGVIAGNTALCSVGRSGNDLHYRGYDILDVAGTCEFEEIAHLLVHGSLPTRTELANYKAKLKSLRGLPRAVLNTLEQLPAAAHPMDVMRSGVSALGCVLPEGHDHNSPGARDIADPPDGLARLHAAVLAPLCPSRPPHRGRDRRRLDRRAFPASAARQATFRFP